MWDVKAGNPDLKASEITRGLVSALPPPPPHNPQERPQSAPWCPGPSTHPDLVLELLSQLSPKWFCNYTFRMCLDRKQQPTVAYPVVHVSVTQGMCDFDIFNEPKCVHRSVKI